MSDSLRIAVFTSLFSSPKEKESGIGVHYRDLALGLRDAGHSVNIFHFPYDWTKSEEYTFENIPVHRVGLPTPNIPSLRGLGRVAKLFRYFDFYEAYQLYFESKKAFLKFHRRNAFDIIEATSNRGTAYSISKIKHRPPIFTRVSTTMKQVFSCENNLPDLNLRFAARFEESQIQRSEYLVTHTENHADLILKLLSIKDRRFQIIPHSIQINQNSHLPNKKASNNIKVFYVGRLENRKGFDVLVKALPFVFKHTSRVIVDIIGEGNLITSAKKALLPQFSSKVVFHGYQSRSILEKFYSECDLFVAPSRYESFGLIYLEAMSFSKPIIACNSGGTPEVVSHNETGFLVQPGNHLELARAIIRLTKDKKLREKMGDAGNSRLKSLFSVDKMIESTVAHYTQSLDKD